jgi:ribonuclease HI
MLKIRPWVLFFDESASDDGCGIGIVLVSSRGATFKFAFKLQEKCTNNQAEYEAAL